ncbi:MAG: RCC1 repeat-containing protein, partial [Myxococcales bacterium]|nr:RCC1 repeat-containing protein [Myxococcales bacterium]
MPGLTGAVELTSGNTHRCARLEDDGVVCWGDNTRGQLGDGTTTNRDAPMRVAGLDGAEEISAGWDHTCARVGTAVYCWGDNDDGQLGDETFDQRLVPTLITSDLGAVEIAAGWSHTCARTSYGEVFCWGRYWGEETLTSPDALHRLVPTLVEGAVNVVEIDAGGGHTCVRDRDGV